MAQRRRSVKKTESVAKTEDVNVEKEITLTPEALRGLVDAMVDEKMNADKGSSYSDKRPTNSTNENLKELISTLRDKGDDRRGLLKYDYEVDKLDYLDDEKLFFTYHFTYHIFGDVRWGQQVQTPYKRPIEFKPLYRYRNRINKNKMISVSMCRLRSKKEYDFMTNHSLYGIKFFETQDGATTIDKMDADKLTDIASQFSTLNEHEVIARAKQEGIEIDTPDVNKIRRRLIMHLADKAGFYKKPKTIQPVDSDWTPNRLDEVVEKNRY